MEELLDMGQQISKDVNNSISYIGYFIKYLSQENIKGLLELIYGENFFDLPNIEYKEFFLSLLLLDKIQPVGILNNEHLQYFKETNQYFITYIDTIAKSIASFNAEIRNTDLKKFINGAVGEIIKNKRSFFITDCSIIVFTYSQIDDKENISKDEFYLHKKQKDLYLTDNIRFEDKIYGYVSIERLKGLKTVERYKNCTKSIESSVNNLKSCMKHFSCHICYPATLNDSKNKRHKCKNCKKIYKCIKAAFENKITTKEINQKIKMYSTKERQCSLEERIESHHKKLIKFVENMKKNADLLQNLTKYETENDISLYDLIKNSFKKNIDFIFWLRH